MSPIVHIPSTTARLNPGCSVIRLFDSKFPIFIIMASSDSENDFSFEKELAEYKEGKAIISKKIDPIN